MTPRRHRLVAVVTALGLALVFPAIAGQEAGTASSSIDGAWRLVHAEVVEPDGTVHPYETHESILLFADGYYSMNWATGQEPSPYYEERFRPTDEEKIDRYGRLLINAGRYTMAEDRLTIHPEFALVPEYVGGEGVFEISLEDDELQLQWMTIVSEDGVQDPMTKEGFSFRYTFERLDESAG